MHITFAFTDIHCKKVNECGMIILCGVKCTSCPSNNQTAWSLSKNAADKLDKAPYRATDAQKSNHCTIAHINTILTDCGSKFGNPKSLENDINRIMRSNIYYCDPIRNGQKGDIEQAHTILRMILPKKTSFKYLTQWDSRTIVNHINSTPIEILGGRTPYDTALENYGIDISSTQANSTRLI